MQGPCGVQGPGSPQGMLTWPVDVMPREVGAGSCALSFLSLCQSCSWAAATVSLPRLNGGSWWVGQLVGASVGQRISGWIGGLVSVKAPPC